MEKLRIVQGSTLIQPVRWYVDPFVYKPISEVTSRAPLRFKVVGHGMPNGWKHEILSVQGMKEINSSETKAKTDYHIATVVDVDTIELNDVNASDWGAYVNNTGVVRYKTPADLANKNITLYIWDKVDGTLLLTLSSTNNDIDIDEAGHVITINMSDDATAALTWKKGVFALKSEDTITGVVLEIVSGVVEVEIE